ncbi:uncharacterized protein [Diadema setosum]|uniref:uncharacterized protein n=1 Tax=Diadema setosum TaxID=31175 RepID=UPI003B3B379A
MASSSGQRGTHSGKRFRTPSSVTASSPVFSTPESPTLLPSIKKLMETQIDRVLESIQSMERKFESKIKKLEEKVDEVVKSVNFNDQNIQELKTQIPKLESKLKEETEKVNQELDGMQSYISRENLLFHGLPQKEEREDSEKVLRQFFVEHLKLEREKVEGIEFQRAHRVNATGITGRPRPIIARFLRYKDRTIVMQNAKNLKGTSMYITEDLPKRVRDLRREQMPAMRAARAAGKLAYFSRREPWKLFVDRVYMPMEKQGYFVQQHPTGIRLQVEKVSDREAHPTLLEQQVAEAARMEVGN